MILLRGLALFAVVVLVGATNRPATAQDKTAFRTATVKQGNLKASVGATGSLEPEEIIDVGAQVAGRIVKFGADPRDPRKTVDFGTPVEEGTILAEIDSAPYRLRVDQARARVSKAEGESRVLDVQVRQAEQTLQRMERAVGVVSAEDRARARYELDLARVQNEVQRAAIKEAEAELKLAELNLSYTTIRAPVKGVILDRRATVGQTVSGNLTSPSLFLVARDLKQLNILAQINEADISQVKAGQAVTFTVEAFPKAVFKGEVTTVRLNATMTKNVVTYTAEVRVDNAASKLLPYMTAEVRIPVAERKNVLLVPNAALNWLPEAPQVTPSARGQFYELEALRKDSHNKRVVWVVEKGYVRPIVIRVGLSDGQATEVLEGDLKADAAVVVGN